MDQEAKKESRKIVNLKASLVSDRNKYSAIIENLSEDSIYLRAVPLDAAAGFTAGELFEIHLESVSGEDISVSGKLKWFYDTPPYGVTKSLGIKIEEENTEYKKLFNKL